MSSELDIDVIRWLRLMESRLRSLERVELPVAGSGGFAPNDAQYLTLATSAGLTNERVFTPVAPLSGADGGAGAAYSLSVTGSALTRVNDTNVTLTLGGTPATSLLTAVSLTLGWTGLLAVARGGTGIGSYSVGDLLYATGATTLAQLAIGASGRVLSSNGTAPLWSTLASLGIISGSGVANEVAFFDGTNTITSSPRITRSASGNLLVVSSGAATDVPLLINLHASQSENPVQIKNSGGNLTFFTGIDGSTLTAGGVAIYVATAIANTANFSGLRVNGSIGAESYVTSGQNIMTLAGRSYNGGTFPNYSTVTAGSVAVLAAENHSAAAFGSYIRFLTVPIGATSGTVKAIISANGNLIVGTNTEAGTSATRTIGLLSGTAPSANVTDMTQVYSNDVNGAGDAGLHVRTEGGDIYKMGDYFQTPGGRRRAFVTKTANYTATANDDIIYCNSASAFTITLPAAASNSGMQLTVKNQNTGVVTVDANSSETIDDATTQTLNQYDCIVIHCDGTEWWII